MKSINELASKLVSRLQDLVGNNQREASHNSTAQTKYTIDEFARLVNSSTRNIRAYQDKGLLPPPQLEGRKGFYNQDHLARFRTVSGLVSRGFSLSSIKELLYALEQGIGLPDVLGVESAVTGSWSEPIQKMEYKELAKMFGPYLTPEAIAKANELELIVPVDDGVQIGSMQVLQAGAEICEVGVSLVDMLSILERTRASIESVADDFVQLIGDCLLEPYQDGTIPPKEDFSKITETVWKLRPLAETAVVSELARAMEKSANLILVDKIEEVLKKLDSLSSNDKN